MGGSSPRLMVFCRDTPARRAFLTCGGEEWEGGYLFSGALELAREGWAVELNVLKRPGRLAHQAGYWLGRALDRWGGHSGDVAGVLANLGGCRRAELVWSTVDTTGIPLSLARSVGAFRAPLVYGAIGLPERLERLPEGGVKRWHLRALRGCAAMYSFGWEESRRLEAMLERPVRFLRYAVDEEHWAPLERNKTVDVLSVGNDSQRDFAQLFVFARRHPHRRVRIICGPGLAGELREVPGNVEVLPPLPIGEIAGQYASARVVALPVKENTYSGATTTLLQVMSMGLPAVVSEVGAIRGGHGFREAGSCALTAPGDGGEMCMRIEELLRSPSLAAEMGVRARAHVCRDFRWARLRSDLRELLWETTTLATRQETP